MISRILIFSLAVVFLAGCNYSPHSHDKVWRIDDDGLPDNAKIRLINNKDETLSAVTLFAIARLYENQNEWQKAFDIIQKAIQQDPMNSSFHSKKAAYAYELGYRSIAYREALTAYQLGSQSLQQSLDLARMGVALSEYSIVEDIIDSLLIAFPTDVDVLYMAARKYHHNKRDNLAERYYQEVRAIDPVNELNNYYYSQWLITHGDLESSKEVISRDSLNANNTQHLQLLLADAYFNLEQYDSAVIYYSPLLKRKDSTIYNRIITCYAKLDQPDSLLSISMLASTSFPGKKQYHILAARELDKRYRYDEAMEYYQKGYELDTIDTLIAQEIAILQRKIAYLQHIKEEQRKLADSLEVADTVQ